jgi:Ca2+-binding RTX toxin-like protein
MAFDIAAIQTLYGANTTTNSGDNTYTLSDPGSPDGQSWQCIWDTGGTDQIVYDGTANAVIDLRPATLDDSPTGGGMGSYTWNNTAVSRGGTIAGDIMNVLPDQGGVKGVVIENAHGGSGNDLITGNDADNVLEGNAGDDVISALAGNDIINGGPGNDTLTGGAGNDVFIFEPGSGHDTITDFTVGQDFLDVSELGVTLADFASQVKIAQIGNTTELQVGTFAGNSIIDLLNVNAAAISPTTDFKYV